MELYVCCFIKVTSTGSVTFPELAGATVAELAGATVAELAEATVCSLQTCSFHIDGIKRVVNGT